MNSASSNTDSIVDLLCEGLSKNEASQIQKALNIEITQPEEGPSRPKGHQVAMILKNLGSDYAAITAAILSDSRLRAKLHTKFIAENFGESIANLVKNINWLNTFNVYSVKISSSSDQVEILRRMLLAMVDDVRAILIKLATRLERLRLLAREDYEVRLYIAQETLDIYSPLANRLGIGQLKWELEDLAFRYLQPQTYKNIAQSLSENRIVREKYLDNFLTVLKSEIKKEQLVAEIYGRPKHIYSIWKKMQRKQVEFSNVFDLRAVRIIVEKVSVCYSVLGMIHGTWQYVPEEFDDYIANPKPNGYQSLHTVIIGPEMAMIEIQIRTQTMHEFAELGVAAHWRYKEGGKQDSAAEKSIQSLRKLLEHKEGNEEFLEDFRTDIYINRIFVMTPGGDLKDLPKGSTPLDFAYAIHTEIGHSCRGAKVNNRMVPLTYTLNSGEQVEILTIKNGTPNRNWLEPHLGYLHTPHARSKIRHWIRKQNHERNLQEGKSILDRERQLLGLKEIDKSRLISHFHLSRFEELLISIGRADISPVQLADALSARPKQSLLTARGAKKSSKTEQNKNISVLGVDNLLTTFAQCCKPVPGDPIIGFITNGKGIAIHSPDCNNILHLPFEKQSRLIDVKWGQTTEAFVADIFIRAFDRENLLRDITQIISNEKINIRESTTRADTTDQTVTLNLTLE